MADNSDEDKEELTNHNLLLCFLNENPESDLEDYETSSPALSRSATKIPNNHPLACLKGKIVFKNEVSFRHSEGARKFFGDGEQFSEFM